MSLPRPLLWMPVGSAIPGGHQVQLQETSRALADLGCDVTESLAPEPPLAGIDIVHGFGLDVDHVMMCRRRGLPIVISTIYWERGYRYGGPPSKPSARSLVGRLSRAARFSVASLRGKSAFVDACMIEVHEELAQTAVLSAADILLPNAEGEARSLQADLGVGTTYRVVPNGVDPTRFTGEGKPFGERDTVLFVGRIEPHKNQLGLLEALRDSGLRLVLAGFPHKDHPEYLERCRAASAGWAELVVGPSNDELVDLYHAARVHVIPSWFETTGLVSLEAALAGCNVVSTNRGYAREYFGDFAWYCDPAKPESIRGAVEQAWNSGPRPELREHVLNRYTWKHVAEATLAAYHEALARHGVPQES
jgi:glycosyltransferase involved in cell wall biosynthesis